MNTRQSKTSVMKDNSWIRKFDEEEESVDQDPNFGKSILTQYKTNETLVSPEGDEIKTTKTVTTSSSVQALSKRFTSKDELKSSTTLPPYKSSSSTTKQTYSILKSDSPSTTTTTTVTKDGTTETTVTTSETVRSPVSKTPNKTETFTERVKSSSKGEQYSTYTPTRTPKVTQTTVTSNKDAEDKLYDTLLPSYVKDDFTPIDSKTSISKTETVMVKSSADANPEDKLYNTLIPKNAKDDVTNSSYTTETVTVKSSTNGDFKTTTTTRSSSKSDDLYDTYLPKTTISSVSSPVSSSSVTKREIVTVESSSRNYSSYEDIPSTRTTSYTISSSPSTEKTYSYSRQDPSYEYSSPTVYSSSSYSRSDDIHSDSLYSKSSVKSVYTSPDRKVLEKDLCTYCRKPFTGDAKIVLDDMKINCHASCFKCEVCNSSLGYLKAGDSMWIYKRMVHCENCFGVTRDKWRR